MMRSVWYRNIIPDQQQLKHQTNGIQTRSKYFARQQPQSGKHPWLMTDDLSATAGRVLPKSFYHHQAQELAGVGIVEVIPR